MLLLTVWKWKMWNLLYLLFGKTNHFRFIEFFFIALQAIKKNTETAEPIHHQFPWVPYRLQVKRPRQLNQLVIGFRERLIDCKLSCRGAVFFCQPLGINNLMLYYYAFKNLHSPNLTPSITAYVVPVKLFGLISRYAILLKHNGRSRRILTQLRQTAVGCRFLTSARKGVEI